MFEAEIPEPRPSRHAKAPERACARTRDTTGLSVLPRGRQAHGVGFSKPPEQASCVCRSVHLSPKPLKGGGVREETTINQCPLGFGLGAICLFKIIGMGDMPREPCRHLNLKKTLFPKRKST